MERVTKKDYLPALKAKARQVVRDYHLLDPFTPLVQTLQETPTFVFTRQTHSLAMRRRGFMGLAYEYSTSAEIPHLEPTYGLLHPGTRCEPAIWGHFLAQDGTQQSRFSLTLFVQPRVVVENDVLTWWSKKYPDQDLPYYVTPTLKGIHEQRCGLTDKVCSATYIIGGINNYLNGRGQRFSLLLPSSHPTNDDLTILKTTQLEFLAASKTDFPQYTALIRKLQQGTGIGHILSEDQ